MLLLGPVLYGVGVHLVILGMRADPSDVDDLPVNQHHSDDPVPVALDIKYDAVVADHVHRVGHLPQLVQILDGDLPDPGHPYLQGRLCVRVRLVELPYSGGRDDSHGLLFAAKLHNL